MWGWTRLRSGPGAGRDEGVVQGVGRVLDGVECCSCINGYTQHDIRVEPPSHPPLP